MKICKECGKKIEPKPHAMNVKFCSITCRNKYQYSHGGAEKQRHYSDLKASKPAANKIQCLICKKYYRKVGAHVVNRHDITARDYKVMFDLEVKRGLLTEYEREPLREHVMSNGTVENLKAGKKFWFKKGGKNVGRYHRSHVTMERLKKLHTLRKRV